MNAQKIMELENRLVSMESKFKSIKDQIKANKEARESAKTTLMSGNEETKKIYDDFNTKLEERVRTNMTKELDQASKEVDKHKQNKKEVIKQNAEFNSMIRELDHQNFNLTVEKRRVSEQYKDLQNEYDFLKKNFF